MPTPSSISPGPGLGIRFQSGQSACPLLETGAGIRTLRESLGLSAQQCADIMTKGALRTWQRYEECVFRPSNDAVQGLLGALAAFRAHSDAQVSACLKRFLQASEKGTADPIVLLRYSDPSEMHLAAPELTGYPCTMHAAVVADVSLRLMGLGIPHTVRFAWEDPVNDISGENETP